MSIAQKVKYRLKKSLPAPVAAAAQNVVQHANRSLPGRRVHWGNIAEHAPFSNVYGWDRGLPVDRYFIERFVARQADRITGSVLEVRSPLYTERFGRPESVTVLDVNPDNPDATLVADLDVAGVLPAGAYDCVILTQTLQYTDPVAALDNVRRSLRPGGCALISVPSMGRIDPEAPGADRLRWTPPGLQRLLDTTGLRGTAEGFGNSFLAAAFLLGVASEEVPPECFERLDPAFPIVACAFVETDE